jgi:hypothetical protein
LDSAVGALGANWAEVGCLEECGVSIRRIESVTVPLEERSPLQTDPIGCNWSGGSLGLSTRN